MNQAKGFTLVELMIVVTIISILAAIAIPSYSSYVTRSKIVEATSSLSGMRVLMEQYYQDNRTYLNGAVCGAIGAVPTATKYFNYTCTNVSANTYTLTANGSGTMSGFGYTVDQGNNKTSAITGQPLAQGWSNPNPNTCWTTNKGGQC